MSDQSIYTSSAVANFFLDKAKKQQIGLSPLKLIKLVYIAHGWALALTEHQLFDEQIEAWQHGPVIPSLYHEFKNYGSRPIKEPAVEFDFTTGEMVKPKIPENAEIVTILDKVWDVYHTCSAVQLRGLTHQANTPWSECYQKGMKHLVIDNDKIKSHYQELLTNMLSKPRATASV
jgi:uncharacterized phage-associated protein